MGGASTEGHHSKRCSWLDYADGCVVMVGISGKAKVWPQGSRVDFILMYAC